MPAASTVPGTTKRVWEIDSGSHIVALTYMLACSLCKGRLRYLGQSWRSVSSSA